MMSPEEHLNKRMDDCVESMVEDMQLLIKELDTVIFAYENDNKFSLKRFSYLINKRIPHYTEKIQKSLRIYDRTEKRYIDETM